jgi:hypothetical protein
MKDKNEGGMELCYASTRGAGGGRCELVVRALCAAVDQAYAPLPQIYESYKTGYAVII